MRKSEIAALLTAVAASAAVALPGAAYGAIASTQKYTFQATPAAPAPVAASSKLGSGTLSGIGLGLEQQFDVQIFNGPLGNPYLLVKGTSPLLTRVIVNGNLTAPLPQDAADYSSELTFTIPPQLQIPAAGITLAPADLDLQFPAQLQTIAGIETPLASSSGCSTGWTSSYTGDYTRNSTLVYDSSQTVASSQFCPTTKTGPVALRLRAYFDSVQPDISTLNQFAAQLMHFKLPKNITLNLATLPQCPYEVAFNNEKDCPGYTPAPVTPVAPQPGPQGPPGPAGPAGKDGRDGQLVVVAYKARVSQSKVTVSYALTGPAKVTMSAQRGAGKSVKVASAAGKAGLNSISWNRQLSGRAAAKGNYKVTLRIAGGSPSTIAVKLR